MEPLQCLPNQIGSMHLHAATAHKVQQSGCHHWEQQNHTQKIAIVFCVCAEEAHTIWMIDCSHVPDLVLSHVHLFGSLQHLGLHGQIFWPVAAWLLRSCSCRVAEQKNSAVAATAKRLVFNEVALLQFPVWQASGKLAAVLTFLHNALCFFGDFTLVHYCKWTDCCSLLEKVEVQLLMCHDGWECIVMGLLQAKNNVVESINKFVPRWGLSMGWLWLIGFFASKCWLVSSWSLEALTASIIYKEKTLPRPR